MAMWLNRLKMWAVRLKLQRDEQIRALTAAVTATAQTVNDRDAHIRALTAKLQERDSKIAELAKQNRLLTAAMTGQSAPETSSATQEPANSLVVEAGRHLEKALSHISPSQPSYGSRWQPQIDAIRRDIPALRDSISCLHYAQKEITFDGRPPFPSDMMQIQFREWAVENEFPNLIPTLRQMYDNPSSYPESLGQFNGRTISRIFYCHARIVLAGITYANGPKRILEIGGGYGEIARFLLTNMIAPADS